MMLLALLSLLAPTVDPSAVGETIHWPQFRGAQSDGLAEGASLPEVWSTTKNVVWKTDLPGWGWSSPVIWGDKIFVTAAVSEHQRHKLVVGGYPGGRVKPTDEHRWMTYCLDFDTGKVVWERQAHRGAPPQQRHPKNSYANATPITDGERLFAYIGNIGMFCYDMNGEMLWEQRWGGFPMRGGWGPGASPVLHKDRIYLVNDNPICRHAPPIETKPAKTSLDDWVDQMLEQKTELTAADDNWLLLRTAQLDDNDRVWVERIERRGNQFTIVVNQAIWQGRYFKTFTYYSAFGVKVGKLPPGQYKATCNIKPLVFKQFDGDGRPRSNWPKNERPAEKKRVELQVTFRVAAGNR